jgi:hypothetical protein
MEKEELQELRKLSFRLRFRLKYLHILKRKDKVRDQKEILANLQAHFDEDQDVLRKKSTRGMKCVNIDEYKTQCEKTIEERAAKMTELSPGTKKFNELKN